MRQPQPLNQPDKTGTRKYDDSGSSGVTHLLDRKEHGETTRVDIHYPSRVDGQRAVTFLGKLTQVHAEPRDVLVVDELRQHLRDNTSLGFAGAVHRVTLPLAR